MTTEKKTETKSSRNEALCTVSCLDAGYSGQPYHGEVCLHFAIIHGDLEFMRLLVEHGADCSGQHASGDFFYDNEELYFGGTLLGFAACLDKYDMVSYLLENPHSKADLNQRDVGPVSARTRSFVHEKIGNTALHCLAYHQNTAMIRHLVENHKANLFARNANNLTPLGLAAEMDYYAVARGIIESTAQVNWSYGPLTSSRYPLYEIERQPGSSELSIIEMVVTSGSSQLLYVPVIWQLLVDRWISFGRAIHLTFTLIELLVVISLNLGVCSFTMYKDTDLFNASAFDAGLVEEFTQGDCNANIMLLIVPIPVTIPAYVGDIFFFSQLFFTSITLFRRLALLKHLKSEIRTTHLFEVFTLLLPAIALPFRFLASPAKPVFFQAHIYLLAMCSFFTWLRFMRLFCNANKMLGPMVETVFHMLKGDVFYWLIVFACFLGSFFCCFSIVLSVSDPYVSNERLFSFNQRVFQLLLRNTWNPDEPLQVMGLPTQQILLTADPGTLSAQLEPASSLPPWFYILQVLWVLLGAVVMMNLLIAMMGATYSKVMLKAEANWRLQFADLILMGVHTPWFLVPPWVDKTLRPQTHVKGTVQIISAAGGVEDVETYFLQLEESNRVKTAPDAGEIHPDVEDRIADIEEKLDRLLARRALEAKVDTIIRYLHPAGPSSALGEMEA